MVTGEEYTMIGTFVDAFIAIITTAMRDSILKKRKANASARGISEYDLTLSTDGQSRRPDC